METGFRRVLGVFAHPDDETVCAGGTLAMLARQGAEVTVVSATRGEAGQIRDARLGGRRSIGRVREAELGLACERLGAARGRCLQHLDGHLADGERQALVAEVAELIDCYRPDLAITFGPDGGYGHPDHVAIGAATTAACQLAGEAGRVGPPRLYHCAFPPGDVLLTDRLASWLTTRPEDLTGTVEFAHALLVLAEEAATMRQIRDHTQVRWYPAGCYVVEQGEAATELFLVLSGEAEVRLDGAEGDQGLVGRIGPGQFFGELGIAHHRPRSANVIARESLTCLVLSAGCPTKFAGRGAGARLAGTSPERVEPSRDSGGLPPVGHIEIDVSSEVSTKMHALSAHRSQFPFDLQMFPPPLLQEIFGIERFVDVPVPVATAEGSGRG